MRLPLLVATAGGALLAATTTACVPLSSRAVRPGTDSAFVRAHCVAADSVLAGKAACVLRDQRPTNVRIF